MKINSKHYILIIFAVLSVIISALGYWYVYSSVIKQAESYSQSLQQVAIENDKKQHLDELSKIYSSTLDNRNKLSNYILTEDNIVKFIESVEAVGGNSGSNVILSSINNEDLSSSENGTFGHLKGHIDVGGSWENVMRAIILIENLPYNISLDNINLVYQMESSDLANIKVAKTKLWKASFDIQVLTVK